MSTIFNYSSGLSDVFNRLGSYLPGNIVKSYPAVVETLNTLSSNDPIEFGQVVVRGVTSDNLPYANAVQTTSTASDFYGVAVKDVTSQFQLTDSMVTSYRAGQPISVLTKGYIAVPIQNGTPTVGGQVYVRTTADSTITNLPIGGIEANASSAPTGTVAWEGATFASGILYPVAQQQASTTVLEGFTTGVAIIKIS